MKKRYEGTCCRLAVGTVQEGDCLGLVQAVVLEHAAETNKLS